ncbi:3915_t:CDS:2, partial [Gigaspora margarita]
MDDNYDHEFSTYSTSSSTPNTSQWTSTLDQNDEVSVSFSQLPPPPLTNETSNSNNNAKLSDKPELPITKAKCKIESCQTQYIWHGSTTNIVNHLRNIHHITKTSLEHSSDEELKKSSQQTIETTLLKPYLVSRYQKLIQNIIKFLISYILPLSLIENKHFRTFLNSFNSRYKLPCVNTIKNEIVNRTNHTTQAIKNRIIQTNTVSFTFELWTSWAHDSYLGVTCHWNSDEFYIYDLTLGVIKMGTYKTANDIIDSIEPMLEEFGLEGMRLSISDSIANIFCAAHTLQLSVEAGLEVAHNLFTKYKALISLLSGEKKRKQLREAQIRVGILKANTVDNSIYMAFEGLANLECPIKWLTNDLENLNNNDYCYDGANIHDKLLSNEEFKVVQVLVELLYPFDKATEILSGSNYTTLSIMVPTIKELVYRLNNTNTDFDLVNEVKKEILSNLSSRWSLLHDYEMYASLLDPQFKNLSFCSN